MIDLTITNALIINEGERKLGTLRIDGGLIEGVDYSPTAQHVAEAHRTIDASGLWLLPGVIDDHVHFREPGLCHKADMRSESEAAVAGGVTSFMDMPNTMPQTTTLEVLDQKFALAAARSVANYSFYLGATNHNMEQVVRMDPRRVCGLKVFMGSSTGNMLVDNSSSLEQIFRAAPTLIAAHCEDEATIRQNTERIRAAMGDAPPFSVHARIRDAGACWRSSSLAVELAKRHSSRLHLLHLSTAKELALLEHDTPLRDKRITGEVCTAHLWLNDTQYDQLGWRMKCNPSVKSEADRLALLNGLYNGTIDVVGTDHAPHLRQEKERPYYESPSGLPSIQHALPMMLELSLRGHFSVETVVQRMCHAPAELFRIDRRGYIRPGYHADLVLIDPRKQQTVEQPQLRYKCGWSAIEGETLSHSVHTTIVNGRVVYEQGQVFSDVCGNALVFNR